MAEHLRERLQPADVAVMVGTEDVDEPVEALRVLPAHVGGIGGEVRRRPVGADEDAILLVAVGRRAGPQRAVLLERVEERDRLGDLGLDDALPLERVELDPEPLERRLDQRQHPRHRIAFVLRERGDVVAVVAVLGRLLAAAHGLDRLAEAVHLAAGVVVVVLALDRVPGEREQPRDAVAVGAVARRRDGHRAGRVGRHHLDLHALGRRGGAAAEVARLPRGRSRARPTNQPSSSSRLTKPGPATDARATPSSCRCGRRQLLGDLARRPASRSRRAAARRWWRSRRARDPRVAPARPERRRPRRERARAARQGQPTPTSPGAKSSSSRRISSAEPTPISTSPASSTDVGSRSGDERRPSRGGSRRSSPRSSRGCRGR